MIGLDQTAAVYTRSETTRKYEDVAVSVLRCRLTAVSTSGAGEARAELAATRRLLWGPDQEVPEGARVVVDGVEGVWQTVRGSFAALRGPSGSVVYQRCDCQRAEGP